jgi:hypothetical protein
MKYFFEIENWQKYFGCISIGKQCFHHIHVPYAPETNHFKPGKSKNYFSLDHNDTQSLPDKEIQSDSIGIRYEKKGWMSHGAFHLVCPCHIVTYSAE